MILNVLNSIEKDIIITCYFCFSCVLITEKRGDKLRSFGDHVYWYCNEWKKNHSSFNWIMIMIYRDIWWCTDQ